MFISFEKQINKNNKRYDSEFFNFFILKFNNYQVKTKESFKNCIFSFLGRFTFQDFQNALQIEERVSR